MANRFHNILKGEGISKVWDGKSFDTIIPVRPEEYSRYINDYDTTGEWEWKRQHWGCDGRIYASTIEDDMAVFITASATPMYVVGRLSALVGDTVLDHVYYDQDQPYSDVYKLTWKNGKMIDATVRVFDYEKEEYVAHTVAMTEQYNAV